MTLTPPPATQEQMALVVGLHTGLRRDPRKTPLHYVDVERKPIITQIPLVETFERLTKLKTDTWQKHFLNYLQTAVENMHIKPSWDEFHAEPQLGKTRALSQIFPAWCFGHDPMFRYTLAMYNISRSTAHADVVIQIMRSPLFLDLFPNKDCHLPKHVSREGFMTNARRDIEGGRMDAQRSLNPVGLESGMTGSGTDWLTIDDPYKEPKDAFSEAMWENLDRFWKYGVQPRLLPHTCVAAMFHRYSYDDFGGYLLNTGKFNYIRYATVADGAYIHEETGQRFEDPLSRKEGQLICPERRPAAYYTDKREDGKVWLSMFQGRPGHEEGDFFQVDKIEIIQDASRAAFEWEQCSLRARGWDHAATQGAGDHSAGGLMGLSGTGTVIVADVFSGQLDSASRVAKQRELAVTDGINTTVVIPEGVSSDGKDVVFLMRQNLKEFNVAARKVTNAAPGSDAKKRRAYSFSVAVNSGKVKFLDGPWVERVIRLMRRFGSSTSGDDECDALSDAYNFLYEEIHKGLLITNYRQQRNLVPVKAFIKLFPSTPAKNAGDRPQFKIPKTWTTYIGVKISSDASYPTSGIIVARAGENAGLGECIVVIAEYKAYDGNVYNLFEWARKSIAHFLEEPDPHKAAIWLHPDSTQFDQTIIQKIGLSVRRFSGDKQYGFAELNWYFMPIQAVHPTNSFEQASRLYITVPDDQLDAPTDAAGMQSLRQELATCGYNEKGEPSATIAVLDCLRMCIAGFRTIEVPRTIEEQIEYAMPDELKMSALLKKSPYRRGITDQQQFARDLAESEIREKLGIRRPEDHEDFY